MTRIAFIGVGNMGAGMAANQVKAGRQVVAFDLSAAALDKAVAKEKARRERRDWIAQSGSDYLRRAVGAGYDCTRQYGTERAAHELPGGTLLLGKRFHRSCWQDRSCPSEAALDACLALRQAGHAADVVWLTDDGTEDERDDPYEPEEAVIVRRYLSRDDCAVVFTAPFTAPTTAAGEEV